MTIWYVDPIGGNNANAGTSFAARCQSIAAINAKSAPALATGDTVRIIKSPDPVTTTQTTATWTDGSKIITLAAPITQTVSLANTAWTASTNVTTTTSTNRKYSTASSSIAVNATFTTGLAAYVATGALNLSGYQQISFWILMSAGTTSADGDISLALCSDSAGAVVVNTIPIQWIRYTNGWHRVVVDTGVALGSNINSVALYVNQDRGAQTFLINGIFASKASSDVDSITLSSLITPQSSSVGDWWSVEMIDGTSITLSQEPTFNLSTAAVAQGYGSATGTNSTGIIKREPIVLPSGLNETSQVSSTNWCNLSKSGTASVQIVFSGGWNTTDMSTQTGDSYIANNSGAGIGISITNGIGITNINLARFYYGFYTNTSPTGNLSINATCVSGCMNGLTSSQNLNIPPSFSINITAVVQNQIGINCGAYGPGITINSSNINGNSSTGLKITGGSASIANAGSINRAAFTVSSLRRNGPTNSATNYFAYGGLQLAGVSDSIFNLSYIDRNQGSNLLIGVGGSNGAATINNKFIFSNAHTTNSLAVLTGNVGISILEGTNNQIYLQDQTTNAQLTVGGGTYAIVAASRGSNTVYGGTINGSTSSVYVSDTTLYLQGTANTAATAWTTGVNSSPLGGNPLTLYWQAYNGDTSDNRIYFNPTFAGQIATDATTRHTASGVSWKITQLGNTTALAPSATYPIELPIGQVAVNVGSQVTASIWLYPTTTAQTVKFRVYHNNTSSSPAAYTETTVDLTGHANSWFQTSLVTTPANAGVYSYSICVYGATSSASVYVDDFSVGQV